MATSLDDILSEKKSEAPSAEPPTEAAPPAEPKEPKTETPEVERASSRRKEHQRREWDAQGRDPETGQFKKKDAEAATPEKPPEAPKAAETPKPEPAKPADPTAEMSPKEKAAFAAAADERRKRQALEQELARYRQQPAAAPAHPGQPQAPAKTFWDDPEGAFKTEDQKRREHEVRTRLTVSEMIARSKYQDFDEKVAKFTELAQATPGLGQQMLASADPAEFVYRTSKNHAVIEQAGGVDKLLAEREAKARAEERAKVEAEFKAKDEERERQRQALPGSLSAATGAGRRQTAPVFGGPTPLVDILKP